MSVTVQDYRRTDLRLDTGGDPFWIISRVVDGDTVSGLKDKACVLFSFPVAEQHIIIHEIVVKVTRAFTSGTSLVLGTYTLAEDNVLPGGVATVVKEDAYVESGDIIPGTIGVYFPTVGDFVDSRASGVTINGGNLIIGSATNVPAVVLTPKDTTISMGQAKVQMLISVIP